MSSVEAVVATRTRIVTLEFVLRTLGEYDEKYSTLMTAFKKAQVQVQERPVPDRIVSTKSFLERSEKRVETARQAVGRVSSILQGGAGGSSDVLVVLVGST